MKQIVVISIFFCCLLQIIQTKKELEIGVINFEEAKGAQIYNQLVRFDNPFTKLPQVALALIDHTPTNALFAKVKNITTQDFIIQFFSANTLNATYRYLATTDDSIYMNCSNYKASQFAQFRYPQFENQIQTIAFLSGYHHTGFIKLEVQEFNNKAAKLAIKSNDIKQTAVGICFIAGYGFSLNSDNDGPKFSGRIDSEGMSQQITFTQKVTKELTQASIDELKNLFEDTKTSSNLRANKQQIQVKQNQALVIETDLQNNKVEELKLNNENKLPEVEEINQIEILTCESEQESEEEFEPESETELQSDSVSESEQEQEYYQESQQQQIVQIDEISDDEFSEEEDDEFFYSTKQSAEKPSVDFELQLTLLQDALKKKSQVPQATIKEIIKTNSKKQKEEVKIEKTQPKKKQSEQKEKVEKQKNEKKKVEKINQIIDEPQKLYKNEEIDIQLQQKETHVKSLKKALQLVDTFQEKKLEVVEKVQEEVKQQFNQPNIELQKEEQIKEEIQVQYKGYSSPLIDDIPNFTDLKVEKVKDKKITQKLDGYMQKFSEDTYTQKIEKKKKEVTNDEKLNKTEQQVNQDQQVQLLQLTGQNHSTKIVYEAPEDSLKKFEEDFERRKQEKMLQIKQQLLPENKPSKAKFQSLAQDDQTLRAYKDFFYN